MDLAIHGRVAELADAPDSKSGVLHWTCGFDPHLGHQPIILEIGNIQFRRAMSYTEAWPLSLYRRHRRECKFGYPEDSRTGEFDERKKGWRRCNCPIFVSGTLGQEIPETEYGPMEMGRGQDRFRAMGEGRDLG
jgi:hypothetical protein